MTTTPIHQRPTPERDIQKRQKTKEEPVFDFTGIFFSILFSEEALKPFEIAEEFLVCDSELIGTLSSIEDFSKVRQKFDAFLCEQKAGPKNRERYCEILQSIYNSALNTGPLRLELQGVIEEFAKLVELADQKVLKIKHRSIRTAPHSEKIHILSEINQLKPFLDEGRNAKLLCLAELFVADNQVHEEFSERLQAFFAQVKKVSEWITSASVYHPQLFAKPPTTYINHSPLDEFSDFGLPLLEALGEILVEKSRRKLDSSSGNHEKANVVFENMFQNIENFEWMDLLHMMLSKCSRQDLYDKLSQNSEKAAMVKICKETFKDFQISINRNKVSISSRVSPP